MAKATAVPAAAAAALLVLLLACCFPGARCDERPVRESLIAFLRELAGGDDQVGRDLGWDASLPPCGGPGDVAAWKNVSCVGGSNGDDGLVRQVLLEGQGPRLNGTINATLLCAARALHVLSLHGNALRGGVPEGISACRGLTHLFLSGNQLSGTLPPSLAQLGLRAIEVSGNNFSGELPRELGKLKLKSFLANDNRFNGTVPDFNYTELTAFNVSNNELTGAIPKDTGVFKNDSFWPNAAGMCGEPMFAACTSAPTPSPETKAPSSPQPPPPSSDPDPDSVANDGGQGKDTHKKRTVPKIVMYLGYVLLGAAILAFVLYKICSRKNRSSKTGRKSKPGVYDSSKLTTTTTTASVSPSRKSAYSLPTSGEHPQSGAGGGAAPSASLVVLRRSGTASITSNAAAAAAKELRFEDLLKSPAELLGRGRFGSSYKVVVPGGAALAVKRVKDAAVDEEAFRRRMERVGRAKHPAVLPPLAFYCALQEKLVVYEFQTNGSLAKLLHGSIESSQGPLDWPARLHIAAKIADGMAFMHTTLRGDGASSNSSSGEETAADGPIAHGNLKASNVLFTAGMDPCISEYGVTAPPPPATIRIDGAAAALRGDVRAFGVLLLELLTGKATSERGDGAELARWVTSVIREEWTAEVFDRALFARGGGGAGDGSSEQRMVRLLQVAMRCVDASPGSAPPPTMREVAGMVNAIARDEDDRSFSLEA
ncbi:unnamed protein product [Urochloa decumbens]|uniref:Protein kinase domain-containing protein n=1 Tax=Urochloa decumbens TaxID=240449 RepID=A0ABC9FHJ9_9POAL